MIRTQRNPLCLGQRLRLAGRREQVGTWWRLRYGLHRDELAATASVLEGDNPVGCREEGIVATAADVLTGLERRASLAHQDRPALYELAAEALDAEALGFAVTAIAAAALAFLVSLSRVPE